MKRTLIGLTTLALATGCTSAAASQHPSQHSTRHPTPAPIVVISEKDAGHVVHVPRGDRVELRLHSTYWQPVAPAGGELLETSHHVDGQTPGNTHRCVPGQGCGTVYVDFRAEHTGPVTLRAHRTSCGEAMRCTAAQGRFSVQIVVG